jgi:uncharacterized protein (DUF2267 family)
MMSDKHFVEQVAARAGTDDHDLVARAVAATLALLGQRLRPVDARAVASRLPSSLALHLLEQGYAGEIDCDEMLARLGAVDDTSVPVARAVCRVLAETLDEQARAQLRIQPIRPLFA